MAVMIQSVFFMIIADEVIILYNGERMMMREERVWDYFLA